MNTKKKFNTEKEKKEAIKRLSAIASSKITDIVTLEGGKLAVKSIKDIPEEAFLAVKSIKDTKDGLEVVMYDKSDAIAALCDIFGWNAPKKIEIVRNEAEKSNRA